MLALMRRYPWPSHGRAATGVLRLASKVENTVDQNREIWGERHAWPSDGDEWSGSAAFCGQPYEDWKQSLVDTFLTPYVGPDTHVLEIAPGHGRWSVHFVGTAAHVDLVDLSPSCIDFCKERFAGASGVDYHVNDGTTLPVKDATVDFVWSFDSFVHMAPEVVESYLHEIARVLKPGGAAVIHHAGRRNSTRWLGGLRVLGSPGRYAYKVISMGRVSRLDGWRSNVSGEFVRAAAARAGLTVADQTRSWGPQSQYTVERYKDWVTTLRKP